MITMSLQRVQEADDSCCGFCISCHHEQAGVEPDGEKYQCEECGERRVYGAAQCVLLGYINIESEEDEE